MARNLRHWRVVLDLHLDRVASLGAWGDWAQRIGLLNGESVEVRACLELTGGMPAPTVDAVVRLVPHKDAKHDFREVVKVARIRTIEEEPPLRECRSYTGETFFWERQVAEVYDKAGAVVWSREA